MKGRREFAEAARYADARAEELGIEGWCEAHDIDIDALLYIAEQRALRAALMLDGRNPANMSRTEMTTVRLTRAARSMMPVIQAAVIDGIAIGLTVKEDAP